MTNLKELNRGLKFNEWFYYYNGLVCGNRKTSLHQRITNKGLQIYKTDKK